MPVPKSFKGKEEIFYAMENSRKSKMKRGSPMCTVCGKKHQKGEHKGMK